MNKTLTSQSTAGLNAFYANIYGLVGLGVGLSALVAGAMLTIFQPLMVTLLTTGGNLMLLLLWFVQMALVASASTAAAKNSPLALPMFLGYSALNGLTISFTVAYYTQESVLAAFLSAAGVFLAMAVVGRFIKTDLSGMRKAMMAALFGLIIAGLVNFFLRSSGLSFLLSIVSVLIFSGLIAHDNQRIKTVYYQQAGQVHNGWILSMALSLYLSFINLFLSLLRIMGNRD